MKEDNCMKRMCCFFLFIFACSQFIAADAKPTKAPAAVESKQSAAVVAADKSKPSAAIAGKPKQEVVTATADKAKAPAEKAKQEAATAAADKAKAPAEKAKQEVATAAADKAKAPAVEEKAKQEIGTAAKLSQSLIGRGNVNPSMIIAVAGRSQEEVTAAAAAPAAADKAQPALDAESIKAMEQAGIQVSGGENCIIRSVKFFTEEPKAHSTICLNMIVKNESHVIKRCLESAKPLIDYWVIVDTGSTDHTQEIIKEFMKDIPGELHERPWVNFAHNRNEALQLADGKADYIFFLDADDMVKLAPEFCKKKLDKDSYLIDIHYGGMTYGRSALIKSHLPWEWKGVVHEVITCRQGFSSGTWPEVMLQIVGGGGRSHDPEKFLKDAALLEKALQEEPHETRYRFYLAQSYRDAGKLEASLENYEKRVAMGGWDQEIFWSLYQIAQLKESLNQSEKEVVKAFTKAYSYRPMRLEPLYHLCAHYRNQENYLMGYLVGNFALNAFAKEPRPFNPHPMNDVTFEAKNLELQCPTDVLFLEAWVYDYAFLLEFSICAYWIGKYQEARDISNYLLSSPKLPSGVRNCIESNRKFSVMKLNERSLPNAA